MSKTKVVIEWAIMFPNGAILKAHDKMDAEQLLTECVPGTKIVSRQKTVAKTKWESK